MYQVSSMSSLTKAEKETTSSFKREVDKMPTPQPILERVRTTTIKLDNLPNDKLPENYKMYEIGKLLNDLINKRGVPSNMGDLFGLLNHRAFLWREHCASLLGRLNGNDSAGRLLLDGPTGTGKSATILQLVDASIQVRGEDSKKIIIYLPRDSSVYDQPRLALEIMQSILMLNPKIRRSSYGILYKEAKEDQKLAVNNLSQFLEGLRGEEELIIFVDEANALFSPTSYRDVNSVPLSADRLRVLKVTKDFIREMKDSKLVAAYCRNNPLLIDSTLEPSDLNCSMETLPYLNAKEVKGILQYYKSLGHIMNEITGQYSEKIRFVSGGSGSKLLSSVNYEQVYKYY